MVWPMELSSCSPLRQGEKRIESSLGLCLDFEKKGFRVSLDDGVSGQLVERGGTGAVRAAGELGALCSVVIGRKHKWAS
jgi:hypothetical protein